MSTKRPPARPWYDLVTEQIAVRGWGIAELARRAKVGRPTIYRWRDGAEKPQPGPVNSVADVLGVPRERAVRLAGIVETANDGAPPSALDELVGEDNAQMIRDNARKKWPRDWESRVAAIERELSQPERGSSGGAPPGRAAQ